MDFVLLIISTLFFIGGVIYSVMALRSGNYEPRNINLVLIGLGFVFQCIFLYLRGELHGRCPITNGSEVLVFIAWSLAIMYFALGRAFRLSLLGAFTAPILAVLHLAALSLGAGKPVVARPSDRMDPWLEMHAAMSLLAYGAFALGAIAGVMYLIQNYQLRSGNPGQLSHNLPPIRYLADALFRLLGIGLVLLTIGVISAFFMDVVPSKLHLGVSGAVWIIYVFVIAFFLLRRPAAKWLSIASLIAFAIALITLTAI